MRTKRPSLILLVCFLLFSGCAQQQQLIRYNGTISNFFKDAEEDYKIAYQTTSFSPGKFFKRSERIDIIVSDFNGGNKKNITESINPGENIAFILPKWSPDGKKLAFCRFKRDTRVAAVGYVADYTTDIYVMDTNTLNFQKVYSYNSEKIHESFLEHIQIFTNDGVRWSKDSNKFIVYIDSTSDSQKAKGYLGTPILVPLNSDVAPEEFFGDYDNFTPQFSRIAPVSPNKKYKLIQTLLKDFPLIPGDPGMGMLLRPSLTLGTNALYLEKESSARKIKIYNGTSDSYFWTKDSNYIILYQHPLRENQFYIFNLNGEYIVIDGAKPQVQFSNLYN